MMYGSTIVAFRLTIAAGLLPLRNQFLVFNVLFGKEKCLTAAVPATVPGTKAHDATVGNHGKAGE